MGKSERMKKVALKISKTLYFLCLISLLCFQTSCLLFPKKTPPLGAIFANVNENPGKRPIIIIPGILGTELINRNTGEKVWPSRSISKTDSLKLPISANLKSNTDNLFPAQIIEKASVFRFFPEVGIYDALIKSIEIYGGYKEGNWDNPPKDGFQDTYYVFAYDWRKDNIENARLLIRKIESLKRKLGKDDLKFNVLAHSMGGLIVRYAAMYGDNDLPPDPNSIVPNWAGAKHFNKIFMFGTPNKGAMSAFIGLFEGYYVKVLNSKIEFPNLSADVLFSFPSVFQLLPSPDAAKFYDENLQPLDLDLYNPETWIKYNFGIFSNEKLLKKITEEGENTDNIYKYLQAVLYRSFMFHKALNAESAPPPNLVFFVFGSDCSQTLDAVIIRKNPKTNSWFVMYKAKSYKTSNGKKVTSNEIKKLLFSPGDGRVTRQSLLSQNLFKSFHAKLFAPNFINFFCETHGDLVNNKVVQNNFLTALFFEKLEESEP
jgi:pimeloyl-ACP methyl ester carboxylesterase